MKHQRKAVIIKEYKRRNKVWYTSFSRTLMNLIRNWWISTTYSMMRRSFVLLLEIMGQDKPLKIVIELIPGSLTIPRILIWHLMVLDQVQFNWESWHRSVPLICLTSTTMIFWIRHNKRKITDIPCMGWTDKVL